MKFTGKMNVLYSYNIVNDELLNIDFKVFYENKRRDSIFAAAYSKGNKIIAFRDHLGIIPLYYRKKGKEYYFSSILSDLIEPSDSLNKEGLLNYIGFQSAKIISLFNNIKSIEPGTVIEINKKTGVETIKYLYNISPKKDLYDSKKTIIKNFEFYFDRAIKRSIKSDHVGLYLSGGVDSSLIAYFLLKNGVNLTCYTSILDQNDKHYYQSKKICKFLNIKNHIVDKINFEDSETLLNKTHILNGGPGGTTASLNLVSLWNNTNIKEREQMYFGQNLDTLFMCMGNQFRTYFASLLPNFLSKKVKYQYYGENYRMDKDSITSNYLNYRSNGYVQENSYLNKIFSMNRFSKSQKIILSGVFCGHTPADGESFVMPSVNNNRLISNPYYDVDFAEFIMGIPLKYKFKIKFNKKILFNPIECLKIHKNLYLEFAKTLFPDDIIYPKKSFIVPDFNLITDKMKESFSYDYQSVKLNNIQSRIAVKILQNFLNE